MSSCRSCGAEIKWVMLASGKWHPCDPEEVYDEGFKEGDKIVTEDGEILHIDPLKDYRGVVGYYSHFSTCPDADDFRKKK